MDNGTDVVFGQRTVRHGESMAKRTTAAALYRLLNRLTDVKIPVDTGDFRLMSRRALNVLLAMPEQHRFIRRMVSWIGFRQVALPYERRERFAGETKYPFPRCFDSRWMHLPAFRRDHCDSHCLLSATSP
jgi:dolichol-phosphate mannosyltransferase